MGHGDRSGSWRGSRRSEIGVAEVGHGAGHGMGRGVGDRSGLKWVVGMAKVVTAWVTEIGDWRSGSVVTLVFFFFFFF